MNGAHFSALSDDQQRLASMMSRIALLMGWPELCVIDWWKDYTKKDFEDCHRTNLRQEVEYLTCELERGHDWGDPNQYGSQLCARCHSCQQTPQEDLCAKG